jgi:hypothetical protein
VSMSATFFHAVKKRGFSCVGLWRHPNERYYMQYLVLIVLFKFVVLLGLVLQFNWLSCRGRLEEVRISLKNVAHLVEVVVIRCRIDPVSSL